ncbi:MAG: hypothetical protein LAP13_23930 [Acidobacteriia bacterium]|nr:hypothetical protein [Terriglobia bacterium]
MSVRNAGAQGHSPVEVVHATTHDVSPPLDSIVPLPPEATGAVAAIPLRPTRPGSTTSGGQLDSVLQSSTSAALSTSTGQDFLGVGNGLPGFTVQYIPPDTNGAAGATQFVQWVNASFAVFNKSNGSVAYGPAAGNTLWSGMSGTAGRACAQNNSGDPIAQYDKQAGRWVMMQPVFKSPYYLCAAVSQTSDATGSWNRYAFPIPSGQFPDYPKLAVWDDAYYVTYNQFQGNTFVGAAACAMDGASMRMNNPATMQCFSVSSAYGSLLPADLDGSTTPPGGSPEYFVNFEGNQASLDLWQFHVDFTNSANSTLTGPTNLGVAAFNLACGGGACIPQKGTTQVLDSLGDRLMYRVAYRNFSGGANPYESMLISHSVDTGDGNTGVRWYELQNSGSGFGVYQQGTYAPDSNYRWMGSIAQDKAGDIALGYSVSSSTMSPTIRYTGRVPTDGLGTMEGENDILAALSIATGSQTSYTRWGDYSSMALDPTDDCTFWYTNEYQPTNGNAWSTRIASFSFSGCTGGTGSPNFSLSSSPTSRTVTQGSGASYTITVTPSGGFTGNVSLSVTSPSPLPTGLIVGFSPNPVSILGTNSALSTLSVSTTSSTPAGTYSLTVTGTNGSLSNSTTVTLQVNQASTGGTFTVAATPLSQIVTRTGSANYAVTVTPASGFTGSVTLTVTGAPPRSSTSFNTNPVSITGTTRVTSTLTVKTSKKTATGTFSLTITGTSGTSSSSAGVSLTVQ